MGAAHYTAGPNGGLRTEFKALDQVAGSSASAWHSSGALRRESSAVSDMMTLLRRPRLGRSLIFFIAGIICGPCLLYSGVLPAAMLSFRTRPVIHRQSNEQPFAPRLPPFNCTDNGTSRPVWLLIMVLSTPNPHGEQMRLIARNTWITHRVPPTVKLSVKFMLGTKGLRKHQIHTLNNEQQVYNDLVLFDYLVDTYYHLTSKVQLSVLWAVYNEQFDYLVKTDDDVAVDVHNMAAGLIKLGCPGNLYWGRSIHKEPDTEGKWKETSWTLCSSYLPYCAGLGYMLGRQVVEAIALYGRYLRRFNFEDISMSLWVAPYNLTRVSSREQFHFHNYECDKSINKDIILVHQTDISSFRAATNNLLRVGRLCNNTSEYPKIQ